MITAEQIIELDKIYERKKEEIINIEKELTNLIRRTEGDESDKIMRYFDAK